MKRTLICAALLGICMIGKAQVSVTEPEFVGTYYHLTSDSTFVELPKENGSIKKHESKVSMWAKLAKGASNLAGAAGLLGIGTSGSMSGIATGARVVTTASGVSSAASTVGALAGAVGMDIVFSGKASAYSADSVNGDLHIIVKASDNNTNPVDLYRIVRFNTTKKERRVQWLELGSSLLGSGEAEKNGYISFSGKKYGEASYILTIPASELKAGQYGIFFMNVESSLAIPVATFGID